MNQIVGDQGFEFTRIIRAMQNSPSCSLLRNNISNLKVLLDIQDKDGTLVPVITGLTFGLTELSTVLETLLKLWRKEHQKKATLGKLIQVLAGNELGDFAEQLQQEFRIEIERDPATSAENHLPPPPHVAGSSRTMSSAVDIRPNDLCRLDFGDHDVKQAVLKKLAPEITKVLSNIDGNKLVLLQLNALEIFDDIEIGPVIHRDFRTEQHRITELIGLFQSRESEEIRLCLEMLCNLDNMPAKRKQFRNCFQDKFPGCVKDRVIVSPHLEFGIATV